MKIRLFSIIFLSLFAFVGGVSAEAPVKLPEDSLYQLNSDWINEDNKSISLLEMSGRPRIIAMVYTKCQTACPLIVQDIKTILSKLPEEKKKNIHISLFSFESEQENAKTLSGFKTKYKLDKDWSAYAGSKAAVAEMAATLGVQYKRIPSGDFIHSNVIFYLNDEGQIVARQEGLNKDSSAFVNKVKKTN